MSNWTKTFALFSLSCVSLATTAFGGPITAVVVYGDSLSDNGNLYAASGNTFPPSPPYFPGRRSNGPVAVEQLATDLGVPLIDYAWIGATTGIGNFGDGGTPTSVGGLNLPGLATELAFTQAGLGPLLSTGLFVVWGGPNDFLSPSVLDLTPQAVVTRAVTDLISIVTTLSSLGASHILVPGLPDLGLTPYFQSQGVLAAAQASALTDAFNALLYANLPSGATFFDTASYVRAIAANPAAFGLTNVTDACFNGITVCANPS
ncbi:MAG: SGNH/GDSL hydrolase family protein, partial [Acidobacteriota bacterium]